MLESTLEKNACGEGSVRRSASPLLAELASAAAVAACLSRRKRSVAQTPLTLELVQVEPRASSQ